MQPTVVYALFRNVVCALVEEVKFLKFIENDKWPMEMEALREKLLRTTIMGTELTENQSNDESILESLVQAFHRPFTTRDEQLMGKLTICRNQNAVENSVSNNSFVFSSHTNQGGLAGDECTDDAVFSVNANNCNCIS